MKSARNQQPGSVVVFDNNVYVDALGIKLRPDQDALKIATQESLRMGFQYNTVAMSSPVLDGLETKLRGNQLGQHANPTERFALMMLARSHATMFNPSQRVKLCLDGDDNKLLNLALASNAKWLVTSDRQLRSVNGQIGSTQIIDPLDFRHIQALEFENGRSCQGSFNDLHKLLRDKPAHLVAPQSRHACHRAGVRHIAL